MLRTVLFRKCPHNPCNIQNGIPTSDPKRIQEEAFWPHFDDMRAPYEEPQAIGINVYLSNISWIAN